VSSNEISSFVTTTKRKFRELVSEKNSLSARAFRGGIWSVTGIAASNLLRLISNLIMTHLLLPEAFGLMAMVNTIQVGLTLFTDIGITQSVIRSKNGDDPEFLHVAWTVQALRGTALSGLVVLSGILFWLVAPHLADVGTVYADPQLPLLIAVSSLSMMMAGFQSTTQALAYRDMMMGRLTLVAVASQIVAMVSMILFAQIHASAWALLAGTLVGSAFRLIMSHLIFPGPRMAFRWETETADELWKFGRWIIGSSIMGFFAQQADRLVLGGVLGADIFGFYVIAFAWIQVFIMVIDKFTHDIGYSVFSEVLRDSPERVGQVYLKLSRSVDAACVAGFLTCLFGGPLLIHWLYKPSYAAAASFIPLLALSLLPRRFDTIRSLILSAGQSNVLMIITTYQAVAIFGGLIAGFHFMGIKGALVAVTLSQLAGVPLALRKARAIMEISIWREVAWMVFITAICVLFVYLDLAPAEPVARVVAN
jgi:O-antigen/teichoic acid export membrane protein